MSAGSKRPSFADAAPFWASLALIPLVIIVAQTGSWSIALIPACTWVLFSGLDAVIGDDQTNIDPDTAQSDLFWYRAVTLIWPAVQAGLLVWLLATVPAAPELSVAEKFGLFFGMGVLTGTVGINYAHELMHQRARLDRWLADMLLAMVLYNHFRSEHLLVHHRHVATPRDAVTARYGEGFYRFFMRVLVECPISAFRAERAMLARKGLNAWHRSNPFWRYGALQAAFLIAAFALAGPFGVVLFGFQALIAIWQLELVNYVEHYGLQRREISPGRYEPVARHHSWNANRMASNRLLINLQRHSDHHYKPARPFPLLQSGDPDTTPQLPFGYPVMTSAAMVPPLWRRMMNPQVKRWRKRFYPDISDWAQSFGPNSSRTAL
ncbi:MAG: alkane 1-monooxygenase [Pseudomonadota bacterium]